MFAFKTCDADPENGTAYCWNNYACTYLYRYWVLLHMSFYKWFFWFGRAHSNHICSTMWIACCLTKLPLGIALGGHPLVNAKTRESGTRKQLLGTIWTEQLLSLSVTSPLRSFLQAFYWQNDHLADAPILVTPTRGLHGIYFLICLTDFML